MSVAEALLTRRSVRAFTSTPVPPETVLEILDQATRAAPSGNNIQPWNVRAVTGVPLARLCEDVVAAFRAGSVGLEAEYAYYPPRIEEPFLSRRRKLGWDLYGLLGIARGETERIASQHERNFRFFDAPVGLIFTIDRGLERGSWLDYGMFLQSVMVAARGFGLHTCPQAAWLRYHAILARHLEFAPQEMLVCGMALGEADPTAIENTLVTEREPAWTFTRFVG